MSFVLYIVQIYLFTIYYTTTAAAAVYCVYIEEEQEEVNYNNKYHFKFNYKLS